MFVYSEHGLIRIDGEVYSEQKKGLHILTIVRTPKKVVMGPNTVHVLFGRINNNFILEESDSLEVNSKDNNCGMEDSWLYLKDTVCIVRKDKRFLKIFLT